MLVESGTNAAPKKGAPSRSGDGQVRVWEVMFGMRGRDGVYDL